MHKETDNHFRRVHLILKFAMPIFVILHVLLLLIFIYLRIKPLVIFNSVSVMLYSIVIFLIKKKFTHIPALVAYLEIAASMTISLICLGWDSGFHIWIVAQSATVFTMYKLKYRYKWGLIIISLIFFAFILFILKNVDPLYTLKKNQLNLLFNYNYFTALISVISGFFYLNWSAERTESALYREHLKSKALLLNILPEATADRLSNGEEMIADSFQDCAILFADLVGFTEMSSRMAAGNLVKLLNEIFCKFDEITDKWKLEKIKTIGDAYMVAAGVPEQMDNPSKQLVGFGFDLLRALEEINSEKSTYLQLRIGIHSGKAVAGVIGKKKFTYDLWGDTVNTASRMESHGVPGRIQVSSEVASMINDYYSLEDRGSIIVKGKGKLQVYLVNQK